eukprot:4000789-Amphidinium_carterae.1
MASRQVDHKSTTHMQNREEEECTSGAVDCIVDFHFQLVAVPQHWWQIRDLVSLLTCAFGSTRPSCQRQ